MIDEFNIPQSEDATPICGNPFNGYIPTVKHRKPKGKKATKKALKKAERERDQLLRMNGWLSAENIMMKRAFTLATAVSHHQLNTDVTTYALQTLPPGKKGGVQ